jgi:hypothetical protein
VLWCDVDTGLVLPDRCGTYARQRRTKPRPRTNTAHTHVYEIAAGR